MRAVTATRTIAAICFTAAMVFRASLVVSSGQESSLSSNRSGSDEDQRRAAERLTVRVCSDCHSLAIMTAERRTAAAWLEIVEEMGTRSDATPTELTTIRQFLTRSRGLVAVNTAPVADFMTVLGMSRQVAESVVAYRAAHGRFADGTALARVPGVPDSEGELDPAALWFD